MKKKNIDYEYTAYKAAKKDCWNGHIEDYLQEFAEDLIACIPLCMCEFLSYVKEEGLDIHEITAPPKWFKRRHPYAYLGNRFEQGSYEWMSLTQTGYKKYMLGLVYDKADYVNWLLKNGYITEAELYYKEA